ncbi:unnamed protein product [Closterium sp. NIES-54]
MATPRVLRFDAEGRSLEFSVWLLCVRHLLESQVQVDESLWAHTSSDLPIPSDPAPLGTDANTADKDRYACQRADLTAWKSSDAAACIALSSLFPESEEAHFTQVRTASEFLTAIKARYATPTTVSLGRIFLPFLFPDLASFECSTNLIAHLRLLDSSYRATCIDAQLALIPPPMAITIYFIATKLPERLASVHAYWTADYRCWSGGLIPDSATAAAAAAAAAAAGSGARVRTASAIAQCRPPSVHLYRPYSASDSIYSSVFSLGASNAEVPVASVGTCVDTSPGAAPEDALSE